MRKVVLVLVAAFSALLAVPAMAAEGTLSAAAPTHTWEGSNLVGVGQGAAVPMGNARCTPVYQCDNEHIEVKDTGTLTVDIKAGGGSNDLDVRLFKSDEAGTAPGSPAVDEGATSPVAADERTEPDAKITVRNLKPGFYVVQVAAYSAQAGSYAATATLTPPPPPAAETPAAPPAAAPVQTAPAPDKQKAAEAKRKKKLKACQKKAKKIKSAKKRKAALKKCSKKYGKKKARKKS